MSEIPQDDDELKGLPELFMAAVTLKDRGELDKARDLLREVLRREPRLAEPRLELGRIHLDAGRVEDAEVETREALSILERGGRWLETLAEHEILSVAHGQLAEILRQLADSDELLFGDPEVWRRTLAEAKAHFAKSVKLDPTNAHSEYHSFFLGLASEGDDDGGLHSGLPSGLAQLDAAGAFDEGEDDEVRFEEH
jgi:tetratricopeptide (TPR) repeat protein